jgi:type III secretory pathway lipoprotein EscJ
MLLQNNQGGVCEQDSQTLLSQVSEVVDKAVNPVLHSQNVNMSYLEPLSAGVTITHNINSNLERLPSLQKINSLD